MSVRKLPGTPFFDLNGSTNLGRADKHVVIIGNGYDLHHGLRTAFTSFIDSLSESCKSDYGSLLQMADISEVTSWYDVENNISRATVNSYNSQHPGISIEEMLPGNIRVVNSMQKNLKVYLAEQQQKKSLSKSDTVGGILRNADGILNFNYTNTLQSIYGIPSDKIYFVHGSLAENEIILGTDNDLLVTGLPMAYVTMSKSFLRDVLDFKRDYWAIHNSKVISAKLVDKFKEFDSFYYGWRKLYPAFAQVDILAKLYDIDNIYETFSDFYSNSGYSDWIRRTKPNAADVSMLCKQNGIRINKSVLSYAEKRRYRPFKINIPGDVDPQNIREITIIGHSLKSDIEIISDLLRSAQRLRKVNLVTYDGEKQEEIDRKLGFIKDYTSAAVNIIGY